MKRKFPDWIAGYLSFTETLESPKVFHYWTAVSTIASALRRNVCINQGLFNWYPNFYIFFIGQPGVVKKSTSIDIGKKLLQEVEGINFGPDIVTWQQFLTRLSNSQTLDPIEKGLETLEATYTNSTAITLFSSELGNFLDPTNKEQLNSLTDLWDSRSGVFEKDTKTQGRDIIVNPCVNILGCTTPAWIQDSFRGRLVDWGFSARCVMIYRRKKRKRVAYPGRGFNTALETIGQNLIFDLQRIANLRGEYVLTPEAISLGENWYEAHCDLEERLAEDMNTLPYYQHFIARKQVHIHKLAIILAASQRDDLIIEKEDLEEAIRQVDFIEDEMHSIFNSNTVREQNIEGKIIRLILGIILKKGTLPENPVIFACVRNGANYREVQDA
ncbi:MAG: DUF3987 domain-containing protein, partial [Rhabdochlamydiaceae bacterium]